MSRDIVNPKEFETVIGALASGGGWPRPTRIPDGFWGMSVTVIMKELNEELDAICQSRLRGQKWDYLSHKTDWKMHEDKWDEKI